MTHYFFISISDVNRFYNVETSKPHSILFCFPASNMFGVFPTCPSENGFRSQHGGP